MQAKLMHEAQEPFVPYIDDNPDGPILLGVQCIPMPTALAHIYTDEGFAIGADGLGTTRGLETQPENEQKIFHLHGKDREAACTFAGMVRLFNDSRDRVAFDFISEWKKATKQLEDTSIGDAAYLAEQICELVLAELGAARKAADFTQLFGWQEHLWVCVDGYFRRKPSRAVVEFYHINLESHWRPNNASRSDLNFHPVLLFGLDKISQVLFEWEDDLRLAKYRTDACKRVAARCRNPNAPLTLSDAIEAAQNYIKACIDPIAEEIEQDTYRKIGGRIHVASITPGDGFQWVPGREPLEERT